MLRSLSLAGILVLAPHAFAHHSFGAEYDSAKPITLTGVVTKIDWSNPHVYIYLDVKGDKGDVQHWTLELASPFTMSHAGWSKDSLMNGDMLIAETHPARNGLTIGISSSAHSVMKFVVNGKALAGQ